MTALSANARRAIGRGTLALLTAVGTLALTEAPALAAAQIRYVATTGSDGNADVNNDCLDQANPCKTIQHAVDRASAGDTVSVGAGTYAQSTQIDIPLTITGSTTGTTTITGNGTAPTFIVVSATQGLSDVALHHLSVSHNQAGPGIIALGANLTITDTQISDNTGVGVLALIGTLDMSNSTVSTTTSGQTDVPLPFITGTGVALVGSTALIGRSTLRDNAAAGLTTLAGPQLGPAFAATLAAPEFPLTTATVRDSTVSGNAAGGVVNFGGAVTIGTSTVAGNTAGGVVSIGGTADVQNSTVSGTVPFAKAGPEQGGLIATSDQSTSPPVGLAATPRERAALGKSLATLVDKHRAAVRRASKQLARAAAAPSKVAVVSVSGSVVAKQDGLPDCFGPVVDGGYNLSSDAGNSCKFSAAKHDLVSTDPKLGALADNGGLTKTELLKKGSPAIDAIASGQAGCVSGAADQRGVARPQPAGARCDIGAVELKADPIVIHPNSLPHGTVGTAYRAVLSATGGAYPTYAFSLAPGAGLPDGLSLSSAGVISGTPSKAGSFPFTVSVNDPVLKRYTIVIDAAAAPADNGKAPIANTGADVLPLSTAGGGAVLAGMLLLLAAGVIGRRPGRHRAG